MPDDLKNVAFLSGEIAIGSRYFCSFANIPEKEINNFEKKFSVDSKPFTLAERMAVANKSTISNASLKRKILPSPLFAAKFWIKFLH